MQYCTAVAAALSATGARGSPRPTRGTDSSMWLARDSGKPQRGGERNWQSNPKPGTFTNEVSFGAQRSKTSNWVACWAINSMK